MARVKKPMHSETFESEKRAPNTPGPAQQFEGHPKMRTTHPASERDTSLTGLSPAAAKDNPRPIR